MARGVVLKSGFIYTICNIILRGISFLTVPIFVRLLTTDEFGRYNIFVSYEGILFIFSAFTIHVSIKNARFDFNDTYDDYIKNCIYLDFFNSLFIALVGNIMCLLTPSLLDLSIIEINLLVLSGFCQAVISIYSTKLIMDYRSVDFLIVSFITVIIGIGSSIILIYTILSADHYLGRVIGGVLGQFIAVLYIYFNIFKRGFARINFTFWKYGLKISGPIIPHGLSQVALSSANRIMIKSFFNASLSGVYSLTYTISLIPQILFTSLSSVWEPWFFDNIHNGNRARIKKISFDFAAIISATFICMACVTPEFVTIFATADYYDAIDISIIVLLGCYFATLYYIPCEVEYYHKKTTYIAASTVFSAIINIGLNFILMQFFSYKIAAYISLFTYILYFVFHFSIACKLEPKLFSIRKFIILIFTSMVIILLSFFSINDILIRVIIFLFTIITVAVYYKSYICKLIMNFKKKLSLL